MLMIWLNFAKFEENQESFNMSIVQDGVAEETNYTIIQR